MEAISSPMVAAAKLPVLNPGKFELWKMRIEQYFLMTDYALWEVIVNGDSPPPKRTVDGVEQTYPPEKLARKNELKARAKVGTVADRLELPLQLSRVHSTFHVSNLKKCLSDEPLAIPLDEIHIDDKLYFVEEPVKIMDHEVKRLKQSPYPIGPRFMRTPGEVPDSSWNIKIIPKEGIQLTMTEQNDYISVTRKNCISNDNEGRMIKRNFVEIQGAILVKIRDNTFNGIIGENAFEHINKFLKVVGPIKINRVEKFIQKFYQLSYDNEKMEAEEDDDLDDITDILKIEDNLFDYETPLYELADGKLKEETLIHKANVEESWGDATPGVMKFYAWLIDSFGNFHELDYNVLVKLQECWWKINAHEVVPFTHLENYDQRPYANFKTKKAHDPYLDINRIFGRNNDTRNVDNIQDHQEHGERWDNPIYEPSVCKIRRFEMMKYSFNANEEYIAIKESEYLNHTKDSLDAYRELLRIIDEGSGCGNKHPMRGVM
ncbi:hypothetical protein Tco_0937765 [Tanacetum coccineum]|uniref:Tf2-1-like SH3-like domain-containing protein n=1 Tax=Tanacetum coccineum TaxID=301880 RepID=A0ABQ5DFV8_9ASTR